MKQLSLVMLASCGLSLVGVRAHAAPEDVPEPFRAFDDASPFSVNYEDLSALLRICVIDVGRSKREKADPETAKTGTRLTMKIKRETINEGNRFSFENFQNNESNQEMLRSIQASLERIPGEVPLQYFSRDEQLAYWLNLYNVTLLNQVIDIYPKRSLKKVVGGKNSVLSEPLLNVAGVKLSLDDIAFRILRNNYPNDPLVVYGLFQGIIGGPNIRKQAYTGANVRRYLELNAMEFVNSNRGTYAKDERVFRASSFYERYKAFFPNFQADLRRHLLAFLEEPERSELAASDRLETDIDDWTVTDVYGTYRPPGASIADNNAALMDAIQSSQPGEFAGDTASSNFSAASSRAIAKSPRTGRFSPQLIEFMTEIRLKEEEANRQKTGTVTVEEMGQNPDRKEQEDDGTQQQPDGN